MMRDPTLYLLRHGETEFNVAGRYQGQPDSPLTARGCEQARRHGAWLKELIGAPEAWRLVARADQKDQGLARERFHHGGKVNEIAAGMGAGE